MQIAIIDYGASNLRSVAKAITHINPSLNIIIAQEATQLANASHIILPGVGAFGSSIEHLRAIPNMVAAMNEQVIDQKKPFLGICVGMQLLADKGYEMGEFEGLGWIKGKVEAIDKIAGDSEMTIPHMGWNELNLKQPNHPLLKNIKNKSHVYFVHSYAMQCSDQSDILATTNYHAAFPAIIAKGNIYATQFHPEKSGETGMQILRNFLEITE